MLEARRNDSHGVLVTNGKNVGRLGKLITAVSEGVLLQGASGRLIVGRQKKLICNGHGYDCK